MFGVLCKFYMQKGNGIINGNMLLFVRTSVEFWVKLSSILSELWILYVKDENVFFIEEIFLNYFIISLS